MSKRAFAIACHPDDLEFGMMGTMMLLKDAGYEVHYMNVSNGSLGTDHHDYQTIVRMRREEALNSAKLDKSELYNVVRGNVLIDVDAVLLRFFHDLSAEA